MISGMEKTKGEKRERVKMQKVAVEIHKGEHRSAFIIRKMISEERSRISERICHV